MCKAKDRALKVIHRIQDRWRSIKVNVAGKLNKWQLPLIRQLWRNRFFVLIYIVIGFLLCLIIEFRIGPIWCGETWTQHLTRRMPTLAAAIHWSFSPERMQYVATSDLKRNHQLRRGDFGFPPNLNKALYDYCPKVEDIRNKYLKDDVAAGNPILPENLSPDPVFDPASDSFIVTIRLSNVTASTKFLEPQSEVEVALATPDSKVKGTVLTSSSESSLTTPASKPSAIRGQQRESRSEKNETRPKATPND